MFRRNSSSTRLPVILGHEKYFDDICSNGRDRD